MARFRRRPVDQLGRALRASAPRPRAEFAAALAAHVREQAAGGRPRPRRLAAAAALGAAAVVMLVALGAPGYVLAAASAVAQAAQSGAQATASPSSSSSSGNAKTTICHSTGSGSNPWVQITVSNSALPAHQGHGDLIPAPSGGCPGSSGGGSGGGQYGHGIPICHATGSKTNPWVLIVVSQDAIPAHQAHGDIIPAPAGGCPTSGGGNGNGNGRGQQTQTLFDADRESANVGDNVRFSVTVGGSATAPQGSVTCTDNGISFDAGSLLNGAAVCVDTMSAPGAHTITVQFTPSNSSQWTPSSATQTYAVAKWQVTVSAAASVASASYGAAVKLTASVSSTHSPGPTGSIQFLDGSTPLGAPVALSGGAASATVSSLAVGAHTIAAVYVGDANYGAASASASLTVTKATPTVSLASSGTTSTYGTAVSLTATVAGPGGTPSGSVQFLDGATPLGTAPLSGGTATLSTPTLAKGTHTITVAYSGDAVFAAATSAPVTQTVNAASTTTSLSTSDKNPKSGAAVIFTATVTSGTAAPPGSVVFAVDGTAKATVALTSSGTATWSTSGLAVGKHTVTATFTPSSANYTGSGSSADENVKK